ncbi:glycerate kinase [Clostridium frigoris]|uniref:Glycerate kinase n=1 Tax=Clostridium frigoris TaxID=205327 RepID=A0ABS6BY76_9CLOT|nr:glycerate kinase [Clostridium frigoris]MBU3161534.1 glycerate kinase [Clostridium frigoris]
MKKLKFVIAPDSFKESVSGFEASEAIKSGLKSIFSDAQFDIIPMADGGEGTSEVIVNAQKGEFRKIIVTGPLGEKREAKYGWLQEEKKAIIEVAEACGLNLVEPSKRNPLYTTTFGVGEMILDALNKGVEHLIIGLGGSSTNDGGLGMLQALGIIAIDIEGNELGLGGKELIKLHKLDISKIDNRIKKISIEVACDVQNPFVGVRGATRIFGPQKGANGDIEDELELGMVNFAKIIVETFGIDISNIPKSGAAGGLGGAFILLNGSLLRGVDLVLKHTRFEERIKDADFIITGEGSIDAQTKYGKTISGIAQIAKKYKIPTIVLAGMVGDNIEELYSMGVTSVFGIVDKPKSLEDALRDGYNSIKKTSENIGRLIKIL